MSKKGKIITGFILAIIICFIGIMTYRNVRKEMTAEAAEIYTLTVEDTIYTLELKEDNTYILTGASEETGVYTTAEDGTVTLINNIDGAVTSITLNEDGTFIINEAQSDYEKLLEQLQKYIDEINSIKEEENLTTGQALYKWFIDNLTELLGGVTVLGVIMALIKIWQNRKSYNSLQEVMLAFAKESGIKNENLNKVIGTVNSLVEQSNAQELEIKKLMESNARLQASNKAMLNIMKNVYTNADIPAAIKELINQDYVNGTKELL